MPQEDLLGIQNLLASEGLNITICMQCMNTFHLGSISYQRALK